VIFPSAYRTALGMSPCLLVVRVEFFAGVFERMPIGTHAFARHAQDDQDAVAPNGRTNHAMLTNYCSQTRSDSPVPYSASTVYAPVKRNYAKSLNHLWSELE